VTIIHEATVERIVADRGDIRIVWSSTADEVTRVSQTLRADAVVVCAAMASRQLATMLGDRINVYPVKGYSVTVDLDEESSRAAAPTVGLLGDAAKIVTSRLGADRLRVGGTAEFNGFNRDIRGDRIQPLVDWVRHNFPTVATSRVVPWAGLRPMMPNMMPVVRRARRSSCHDATQRR
jgi:D-amino-acid dehydrogenase